MKSSDTAASAGAHAGSPPPLQTGALVAVDRFVAIAWPLLFLLSCLLLIKSAFPFIEANSVLFAFAALASGIGSVALSSVLAGERSGGAVRVRAASFALILLHAGFSFFRRGSVLERLVPDLQELIVVASFLLEWVWSGQFFDFFLGRELLLEAASGKDGPELYAEMRDDGFLSASVTGDREVLGTMTTLLTGFACMLSVVLYLSGIPVPLPAAACVSLFLFVSVWTSAVFRLYDDEQLYAGMGLSSVFALTVRGAVLSFAVLAVCAVVSFVAVSDRPVFRLRLLAWLFALIARFASRFSGSGPAELPEFEPYDGFSYQDGSGPGMFEAESSEVFAAVMTVLKFALLIASGAIALRFLFGAFFSEAWKSFWKDRKIAAYAAAFLRALASFASLLRGFLPLLLSGASRKAAIPEASSRNAFTEAVLSRLRPERSLKKQKEIGELSGAFLRLVDWGESRGFPFLPNLGPGEYCLKISTDACESALSSAAFLFEKALYSDALLSRDERKSFFDSVDAVLSVES